MGNQKDKLDIKFKLRKRNHAEQMAILKAKEIIKEFIKQKWEEDPVVEKEFGDQDDLFDALMDEFKLSYD